jgi:hypothetical protein
MPQDASGTCVPTWAGAPAAYGGGARGRGVMGACHPRARQETIDVSCGPLFARDARCRLEPGTECLASQGALYQVDRASGASQARPFGAPGSECGVDYVRRGEVAELGSRGSVSPAGAVDSAADHVAGDEGDDRMPPHRGVLPVLGHQVQQPRGGEVAGRVARAHVAEVDHAVVGAVRGATASLAQSFLASWQAGCRFGGGHFVAGVKAGQRPAPDDKLE